VQILRIQHTQSFMMIRTGFLLSMVFELHGLEPSVHFIIYYKQSLQETQITVYCKC